MRPFKLLQMLLAPVVKESDDFDLVQIDPRSFSSIKINLHAWGCLRVIKPSDRRLSERLGSGIIIRRS